MGKVLPWVALGGLVVTAIFVVYHKGTVVGFINSGLKICSNDCTDYDNLSQYIADNRSLISTEEAERIVGTGDNHATVAYRGFVLYVGILKILFGSSWKVAFVAANGLLAISVVAISSRALLGTWNVQPFSLAVVGLACTNTFVLMGANTLLTDFGFAFLAMAALTLGARGMVSRRFDLTAAALMLAAALVFWRPTGVVVFGLVAGTALANLVVPNRHHLRAAFFTPVAIGAVGAVVIAVLSTLPKDPDVLEGSSTHGLGPGFLKHSISMMAKVNLFRGEDRYAGSRVPGSGVIRGRGSGERETTASSLGGKEESSRKEDNSGQGKDGPAGAIAQGGNGR